MSPSSSAPQQRRCHSLSFSHFCHLPIHPPRSPLLVHCHSASLALRPPPNFTCPSPYLSPAHLAQVLIPRSRSSIPHDSPRPAPLWGPRHIPLHTPYPSSAAACPPAPSTALSAQYRHLPSPAMTCPLALSGISSGHSCPSCALSSTLYTAAATSAASPLRPLTPHRNAELLRLVHRIPASSRDPSPYSTNLLYPFPLFVSL